LCSWGELQSLEISPFLHFSACYRSLAIDQLPLRFAVINFQGWGYSLQGFTTHVIEMNGFCSFTIIDMCMLQDLG
jgi:hypothetical protein